MSNPTPQLEAGKRVKVFACPEAATDFEGNATLLYPLNKGYGEYFLNGEDKAPRLTYLWSVQFDGVTTETSRWVSADDILVNEVKPAEPSNLVDVDEQRAEEIGQYFVDFLGLKEAKLPVGGGRRLEGYNPPRYYTKWGTKTALGLYNSIERIIKEGIPKA